ncbi:MAG: DUF1592 domain-containing protein [Verrucomicrobiota bacterium]
MKGYLIAMCRPLLFTFLWLASALFIQGQDDAAQAIMPDAHFDILDSYCLDCHDSASEKGGVNLETLSFEIDTIASAELWQKVLNVTNSGEMPPENKDQLTDEEKTAFLADLSEQLVIARDVLTDSGGVITMRRLNRREYENTVEDLLGVKVDASNLPDDENPGGFDTTGSALFFSSDQFEQYVKIARTALDKAFQPGEMPKAKTTRIQPEKAVNRFLTNVSTNLEDGWNRGQAWRATDGGDPKDFGFIDASRVSFEEGQYKLRYASLKAHLDNPLAETGVPLSHFFRGPAMARVLAPKSTGGFFKVRASIGLIDPKKFPENRHYIEYGTLPEGSQSGELDVHGFQKITGTVDEPQTIEFTFTPQGAQRMFTIRERHFNNLEAYKRLYIAHRRKKDTETGPEPSIWVDWIEIDGPHYDAWPPQNSNALATTKKKDEPYTKYVRRMVENFATEAFRTSQPSPTYIDKLMGIHQAQVDAGAKPKDALKDTLALVLASPSFLYIQEPTHGKKKRELTPAELAVRLSYFLWSSPPDEELLEVAANDDVLMQPEELRKQTLRMLKDPRAQEFIHAFTHQWLHMERLDFFQFDYMKYPDFDTSVKESARHEIYAMIDDAISNSRPIRELLDSDHIMINNLLGNYYGIDGADSENFSRVAVPEGMPRGGLLGTAAVMAMGSDGEKASPIERGVWILRSLLNDPPPPAPANVPQLSRLEGEDVSARELQRLHQEEPQCAQCHRKIDPLGFGLENFDAAGIWRESDIIWLKRSDKKRAQKKGEPIFLSREIDTSGQLPDGTAFANFFELRERVAERETDFARGFTENLIEYALGRPFGFTDQKMADSIMKRAAKKDYAMDEFVIAVVQSWRFKIK